MSTQIFDDAGIDAIKGTEIMSILDLSVDDFGLAPRYQKFKDVVDFIKNYSDYRYVLNKITRGKMVDKLDHAWSYVALAKEKDEKRQKLSNLENEINEVNRFGDDSTKEKLSRLTDVYLSFKKDLTSLEEEMAIYEK